MSGRSGPIDASVTAPPLLDEVLDAHRAAIGAQWRGYRNHCLLVFQLARGHVTRGGRALEPRREAALALAAATHDLGLWTADTLDYLDPSAALARERCAAAGLADLAPLVVDMIQHHHRVRPLPAGTDPLVEAFRRADWSAVTFGLVPGDRFTRAWRRLAAALPDEGFHAFLLRRGLRHALEGHLLDPLPMLRW